MNPHSVAVSAIEAAIETMLLPGSGPVEDAKAETMVVAYFSILDPRHRLQRVQTLLRAHSAYCRSAQGGCMTTPLITTLIDEQVAELPESQAMPGDRVLMLFKGPTFAAAMHQAELASIENPQAWNCRACICGEWTVGYEVRV